MTHYVHAVMRALVAMLIVGLSFDAVAQEPTPGLPSPPPRNPLVTIPAGPVGPAPLPLSVTPTPVVVRSWRRARVVSAVGTLLSIAGTGLSLASVIYIAATHYPPSAADILNPPAPSDPGPVLAYVGSSTSAAGFVFSASALAYQHHLLDRLGIDPGKGRFAIGTTIGLVGFAGVGASYFFGLTHYLDPHDQEIAILATSIGGAALCAIAGLLYTIDSSRNMRVWKTLGTF
jgi:hypothetical protein